MLDTRITVRNRQRSKWYTLSECHADLDLSFLSGYWIPNFFGNLVVYRKEWWQGVWRSWVLSFTWYSCPKSSSSSFHYLWFYPCFFIFHLVLKPSLNLAPWSRSPFVWLQGYIYILNLDFHCHDHKDIDIYPLFLSKWNTSSSQNPFPLLHFIWISVIVIPRVVQVLNTQSSVPLFPPPS